jgi:hypothetical protein
VFIGGGYGYSGYESGPWEKGGWSPKASAGWNGDKISVYATYHWPDDTEYETQAISITCRYQFIERISMYFKHTNAWFDHPKVSTAEALTVGAGWRF